MRQERTELDVGGGVASGLSECATLAGLEARDEVLAGLRDGGHVGILSRSRDDLLRLVVGTEPGGRGPHRRGAGVVELRDEILAVFSKTYQSSIGSRAGDAQFPVLGH